MTAYLFYGKESDGQLLLKNGLAQTAKYIALGIKELRRCGNWRNDSFNRRGFQIQKLHIV